MLPVCFVGLNWLILRRFNLKLYTSNQDLWFKLTFQHMLCRRLMQRLSGMQSRDCFHCRFREKSLKTTPYSPCFFWFHNKYTPSSFPNILVLVFGRYLEKRVLRRRIFFQLPRSLHRRIKDYVWGRKSDEQTRKAKKTWKAWGCESDKRLSTNGDMEIH